MEQERRLQNLQHLFVSINVLIHSAVEFKKKILITKKKKSSVAIKCTSAFLLLEHFRDLSLMSSHSHQIHHHNLPYRFESLSSAFHAALPRASTFLALYLINVSSRSGTPIATAHKLISEAV